MKKSRFGLIGVALALSACPGLGDMLRQYGYTELRPPSRLLAPGTMVWVKNTKPFAAGIICTQRSSLGADFKPIESTTADEQLVKEVNAQFQLGAEYMDIIRADGKFQDIKNITADLSNATVFTVSDVDIMQSVANRDPSCTRAIAARRNADYDVTMIASALQADVTYQVDYKTDTKLDAKAKIATLQNLAIKLGIDVATVSDSTVSGKALYWGVTDDGYLAAIGTDSHPGSPVREVRLIAPDETTSFDSAADAP